MSDERSEERVGSNDLLCPIMAIGWLANKYAAKTGTRTFEADNIPYCHKEKCALWTNGKCSFSRA